MRVTIASAGDVIYSGEAVSLSAPGAEGELTILPHHMPLVTALKAGEIRVATGTETRTFPVSRGVLEVNFDGAVVLL